MVDTTDIQPPFSLLGGQCTDGLGCSRGRSVAAFRAAWDSFLMVRPYTRTVATLSPMSSPIMMRRMIDCILRSDSAFS